MAMPQRRVTSLENIMNIRNALPARQVLTAFRTCMRSRLVRSLPADTALMRRVTQMTRNDQLFEYTSGRWLYNEQKCLAESQRRFEVSALQRLATEAVSRKQEDIVEFSKIAGAASNRVFVIRMRDRFAMVARIPYEITVPRGMVVASEAATLTFLHSKGIPAPKVYGYSASTNNPAGVEYIFMENSSGRILGEVWSEVKQHHRHQFISHVVELERRLFGIQLPASGSLYFLQDLPEGTQGIPVDRLDSQRPHSLHVGRSTSPHVWLGKCGGLEVNRGPFTETKTLLTAGAEKEIRYLIELGRPLLPFDRIRRETFNLEKQLPATHLDSLTRYLQIADCLLLRGDPDLLCPSIRHPDFQPSNVFVSDGLNITSIIDWQYSTVLPLFLQSGMPSVFDNPHDVVSRSPETPRLPGGFSEMTDDEKGEHLEVLHARQLHYDYIAQTARAGALHFQAPSHPFASMRRRIYRLSGAPWRGDNIPLRSSFMVAAQHWGEISTAQKPPCPITFPEDEIRKVLRLDDLERQAEEEMRATNTMLGVGPEGWVPNDQYDAVRAVVGQMKQDCLDQAELEIDRIAFRDHWVYDDMDEDEYLWGPIGRKRPLSTSTNLIM